MTTLLIAEHDNATIKDATNKALTAAVALGAEVDVLVAGENAKGAADAAAGLAGVLWAVSARRAAGLWHWCDSGVASWYDFAVAIAEEAVRLELLPLAPPITPIGATDYPTAARRPAYSVLDKRATERLLGITAPHWRTALRATLAALSAPGAPAASAAGAPTGGIPV